MKFKAGYDDSLDVVGVHFVGGLVGSLLIGLFAEPGATWADDLRRGSSTAAAPSCWSSSFIANAVTIVFSFVMTFAHPQGHRRHHRRPGVGGGRGDRSRRLPSTRRPSYNLGEVTMGRS